MKNLFSFATKELSQDAFLRWLIENYNCENKNVSDMSLKLLSALTGIDGLNSEEIKNLKTVSQFRKIDIFVSFEYENNLYCIAIEDKTFSEEHEQLDNYNKSLAVYGNWLKKDYKKSDIILKKVFYKLNTLSQGEAERVKGQGWEIFAIQQIYQLFNVECTGNNILDDYICNIRDIMNSINCQIKPNSNNNWIDYLKWTSYFNKVIINGLNKNGYKCYVYKAGQYPYICFLIKKEGLDENIPYLEIRSRDCQENNFQAKVLCYGVSEEKFMSQQDKLIENIRNSKFNCKRLVTKHKGKEIFPKQVGFTDIIKVFTDQDFICQVEFWANEYLTIMKDWGCPHASV